MSTSTPLPVSTPFDQPAYSAREDAQMRFWFKVSVLGGMVALLSALIHQSAVSALPEPERSAFLQQPPTAVVAGVLLVAGIAVALVGLLGAGGAMIRR